MGLMFRYTGRGEPPTPQPDRRERIYVYDRDGALVNDPHNTLQVARGLSWRTGLPGGMWDLRFSVPVSVAEEWAAKAAYRLIVRRGLTPLWDGRIEDISRDLARGGMREVLALGWWQELRQRQGTWAFTSGTKYADDVLRMVLKQACPHISQDYSQIQSPALNLVPRTWTRKFVSEIVADLLKYGDNQTPPRQWYFAIWPTERPQWYAESSAELVTDPSFEASTSSSSNPYWSTSTHSGAPIFRLNDSVDGYVTHSGRWACSIRVEDGAGSWQTSLLTGVEGGANYTYDYYIRRDPSGYTAEPQFVSGRCEFDWYTSSNSFISTSTATLRTGLEVPDWTREVGTVTAPASAAKVRVRCYAARTGGTIDGKCMAFDDVHFYKSTSPPVYDKRPRAHFWPRDTSTWDYEIRLEEVIGDFSITESTEQLVNYVIAEYGSSATAAASDADSIAAYDQRDYILDAGDVSATVAAKARDLVLAERKETKMVPSDLVLSGPVRKANGGSLVHQSFLKAGDRIKILDLPEKFSDFLFFVQETQYDAETGIVKLRPESPASSVDEMLAQVLL